MAGRTSEEIKTIMEKVEEFNSSIIYIHDGKETGEECVICGFHLTDKFPDEFPDEFKFCCDCKRLAVHIVSDGIDKIKNLYIRCGFSEYSNKIEKIRKRITLVG